MTIEEIKRTKFYTCLKCGCELNELETSCMLCGEQIGLETIDEETSDDGKRNSENSTKQNHRETT